MYTLEFFNDFGWHLLGNIGDFQYGALFGLLEGKVDTVISGVSNSPRWDKTNGLSGTCDILGRVHQLLIMGIHGNPHFFHFQGFMSLTACKTFLVHWFWGSKGKV